MCCGVARGPFCHTLKLPPSRSASCAYESTLFQKKIMWPSWNNFKITPRDVESACGPTLGTFFPTVPATGRSSISSWQELIYHPGPFRKYARGLCSHDLATSLFSYFTSLADESCPYIRKTTLSLKYTPILTPDLVPNERFSTSSWRAF